MRVEEDINVEFDTNKVNKYQNVLEKELEKRIGTLVFSPNFGIDGKSNEVANYRPFLHMNVELLDPLVIFFKKFIERKLQKNIHVYRAHFNAQAHGQCGDWHTDIDESFSKKCYTLVYYPKNNWKSIYGGFTLVKLPNDTIEIVEPIENSCVIFDSKWLHAGLEPTIHCTHHRITLAINFYIK